MSKREITKEPAHELVLKNQVYMDQVRKINEEYYEEHGKKKVYVIETYGCAMNEHDSENLAGMLKLMGYQEGFDRRYADLVIYNTCCVRENAEVKVYGSLGSLKSEKAKNPNMQIAVCGCMMQQDHIVEEIKKKYRHVDLVFGTHNIHNFPTLLAQSYDSKTTLVEVWDHEGEIIEGLPVQRKYDLKAFVNIMYGCNNFCTYCIVPYTRGRERSRALDDIVNEVKDLVANGTKEVTLIGQNVNSYGKTLDNPVTFAELLRILDAIEGLERLRFMTSHPKDISDEVIDAVAECESVCEYLHLPVQAGSNKMLKEMNRYYNRDQYLELIKKAKAKIPGVTISTDLIIGFPGETEDDIDQLIELLKIVEFDSAFTFIYSPRKGTPAAEMTNQIPEDIKHERFNRVLATLNGIIKEKNTKLKDTTVEVLVEGVSKKDETVLTGRDRHHRTVNFKGDKSLIGQLVQVKVTDPKSFSLNGELLQ